MRPKQTNHSTSPASETSRRHLLPFDMGQPKPSHRRGLVPPESAGGFPLARARAIYEDISHTYTHTHVGRKGRACVQSEKLRKRRRREAEGRPSPSQEEAEEREAVEEEEVAEDEEDGAQETEEKEAEEAEKRRWLVRGIFIKVNARRSPWQRNWIFFSKFFRPFSPAPIPEGGEGGDGGSTEEMAVAVAVAVALAAEGKW